MPLSGIIPYSKGKREACFHGRRKENSDEEIDIGVNL